MFFILEGSFPEKIFHVSGPYCVVASGGGFWTGTDGEKGYLGVGPQGYSWGLDPRSVISKVASYRGTFTPENIRQERPQGDVLSRIDCTYKNKRAEVLWYMNT
jgi:hypothetical protein